MNRLSYLIVLILFTVVPLRAQFEGQLPEKRRYSEKEVVNEEYGIILYEELNFALGGDSVRYDKKGYSASGWIEDYYVDGKLLHKGYYEEGHLINYKNYFHTGQLERSFKMIDLNRCLLQIYYPDGKLRSEIEYLKGSPLKWQDFYPNGNPQYYEENTSKLTYVIQRKSFFENGTPEYTLVIVNEKKKIYERKDYFENGRIKEEGQMIYNLAVNDYQKDGQWKIYDESGKVLREENYVKGEIQ